jgi:hypothetical protein
MFIKVFKFLILTSLLAYVVSKSPSSPCPYGTAGRDCSDRIDFEQFSKFGKYV